VEDRLQLLLQQHRRRSLRHPVARIGDGDFILPLLQSLAGLDLPCCDRRWPRGRADVVIVPAGTDILGCSVPLTGLGLAGRRVEVAGVLDPDAASGLDLLVPGDVQPAARAAAGGELAGVDPVVDDMNAAAELVGGFGDADLAVGGGRERGGQRAGAGGAAQAGGLGDQFPAAGLDLVVPRDAQPAG
jgi:hypothetical protein